MKSNIVKSVAVGCALASLATATTASARPARATNGAKYVFFFLGDGMASVQIQAAEAYLASQGTDGEDNAANLLNPDNILEMNKMPITGMSTTYADTRFITGSAASATAFACGAKTSIRTIGMDTDKTVKYKSVAELAHEQGKSVGIISSVSLPHATPAAYYANVEDRGWYNEIGYQAAQSGFEFFGGGRFRKMSGDSYSSHDLNQAFATNGYVFVDNVADALAQPSAQKVVCSVPFSYGSDAMPYAIDRPAENFSLAEVTETAIARLENDPQGFFIMVEGGKIDWACHANDAMGAIVDTLAFDDAVAVARAFLQNHPTETLIVVTGDHECGGMSLGFKGTVYETAFSMLDGQTKSFEAFVAEDLADYKTTHTNWTDAASSNIDQDMIDLIEANFGLVWDDGTTNNLPNELTDYQKELLEAAYDRSVGDYKADARPSGYDLDGSTDVDYNIYGGYEAISVTLTHILNHESGIHWASSSHTAVPVPVMAEGFDAYRFNGFYDNTDIAKSIAKAMRIPAQLPVIDND